MFQHIKNVCNYFNFGTLDKVYFYAYLNFVSRVNVIKTLLRSAFLVSQKYYIAFISVKLRCFMRA